MTEAMATLGEERINQKRVNWAGNVLKSIVKKGVVVDLHIGRTRFERKITKEDLGLDIPDEDFQHFVAEYLDFGTKVLIPRSVKLQFDRIESRARRNLYHHSFETPWGRFVPYTAYQSYKEKREELEAQYLTAKEELKGQLEGHNAVTRATYRKAALKLYERSTKSKSPEQFVVDFLERIESQLPTPGLIDTTFYFTEDVYYIPLPSEMEEELLKAEVTNRQRQIEHARTTAEVEKIQAEVSMHRDTVARIMETKKDKLDSLIDSVAKDLRGAIYVTLNDVLQDLKSKSTLTGGSVKSLRNLIERTRMMNFVGDEQVEEALRKIEEQLAVKSTRRRIGDMAGVFHDIASEFRVDALQQGELPQIREDFGVLI
jgi:hypothetical protein